MLASELIVKLHIKREGLILHCRVGSMTWDFDLKKHLDLSDEDAKALLEALDERDMQKVDP